MKAFICLAILVCMGSVLAIKADKFDVKQPPCYDPNFPCPPNMWCDYNSGSCNYFKREIVEADKFDVKQPPCYDPNFPCPPPMWCDFNSGSCNYKRENVEADKFDVKQYCDEYAPPEWQQCPPGTICIGDRCEYM